MSDERFVDAPAAGAEGWREVWEQDRQYRLRPGRGAWLTRLVRRLTRRALEPELERQKNFNVALLDLVRDLRGEIENVRRDLKSDLVAVQEDVRRANEALAAEIARILELIPVAAKRNDALIAALD